MTSETPDAWWHQLPPERKETIHRWLTGGHSQQTPEIPGQTTIEDFSDEDQPINFLPTWR